MKKTFVAIALAALSGTLYAQTPIPPVVREYGKVDKADLELTSCDFEKDANAEVLFDKAFVYYDPSLNLCMERQKRVKIFNDNGKDEANITLNYISLNNVEYIVNLQAETINLVDGKIEITKIDRKQIFTKQIDKQRSAIVFSMPNVKPGSIIEFKYRWETKNFANIPEWWFQERIPVKYSELKTEIPEYFDFRAQPRGFIKYDIDESHTGSGVGPAIAMGFETAVNTRVLTNVNSLHSEPFMTSFVDNLKGINFHLLTVIPRSGRVLRYTDNWEKVGDLLADDEDFGSQLKRNLAGEDVIIAKAKSLKTDDQKIAYLFDYVKNNMRWNGIDEWYTNDGTSSAWDKKTGNSAEINLVLFHLLKGAGVNAYPTVASTREHGRVNPAFSFINQFNRAVVYIPVDSATQYVLDATSKYNIYNEVPSTLLNSYLFYIDKDKKLYDTFFLTKPTPVINFVSIDGEITPDGKMSATANISSMSYDRIDAVKRYKEDGEKKYIDYLSQGDNNLKITNLKMENMDVDSLPLNQTMKIDMDLVGSDGTYIYLNPNVLTSMRKNPFTSETRYTNIDFGYMPNLTLNSTYKIPAGYKLDAAPKNITMTMPDNSIIFKRTIIVQDGMLIVRYNVVHRKSLFFKESYPEFFAFYKKLHEMLNEQIVFKKA